MQAAGEGEGTRHLRSAKARALSSIMRKKHAAGHYRSQSVLTADQWREAEILYRANRISIADIARQFNVSHTTIIKKAKKEKWIRDYSADVAEQARALDALELGADAVRIGGSKISARDVVASAAQATVEIVRNHRKDVRKLREIAADLSQRIAAMLPGVVTLKDIGDAVSCVKALADTHAKLQPLERRAFGLADGAPDQEAKEASDADGQKMERLKALMFKLLGDGSRGIAPGQGPMPLPVTIEGKARKA